MAEIGILSPITIILVAAFIGGWLVAKVKQPTVVGYLLAGVAVGWVGSKALISYQLVTPWAEIGVALLMFTLGLEFSLSRLKRVWEIAVYGAIIQVLVVILISILLLPFLGFNFYRSLFLGAAFSLSSTAVVSKILSEKGELETLHGEILVGWLLVQDLLAIALVIILPTLGVGLGWGMKVAGAVIRAVLVLGFALIIGQKIVPIIIDRIAALKSRELLLIAVVAFCLATAQVFSFFGLSIALGAFLAGLLVGETTESHAVFSQIRPLKDIFAIVFFVSLGFFISPGFLLQQASLIIVLGLAVLVLKIFLVIFLVFLLGYHGKTAINVGLGLPQVGEFAFILALVGYRQGQIDEVAYSLILSITLVTLFLTPWLYAQRGRFYSLLSRQRLFLGFDRHPERSDLPLANHVVVCGHGRVGRWLGRSLSLCDIPYIVVDYDPSVINDLKQKNINCLYGDPADIDVLDYTQVDKAKVIVIAIPDQATTEMVVANCQTLNPKVKIVSRAHEASGPERLKALGVDSVIQPEFEASLSIIHKVLQFMGVEKEQVAAKIKRIKVEHGMV